MTNQTIDLMIRIKNGYLVEKKQVIATYSRLNQQILLILKQEGYIMDYKIQKVKDKSFQQLLIDLIYKDGKPAITDIKIISKPGKRIYQQVKYIKSVLGGLGIFIISTPKGIMTDKKAKETKQGGEVLFSVW